MKSGRLAVAPEILTVDHLLGCSPRSSLRHAREGEIVLVLETKKWLTLAVMEGRSAPMALLARASRETESLDKPIFADLIFEVLKFICCRWWWFKLVIAIVIVHTCWSNSESGLEEK